MISYDYIVKYTCLFQIYFKLIGITSKFLYLTLLSSNVFLSYVTIEEKISHPFIFCNSELWEANLQYFPFSPTIRFKKFFELNWIWKKGKFKWTLISFITVCTFISRLYDFVSLQSLVRELKEFKDKKRPH